MKGYTIQHSIDLLEKAVDNGGSGGASTAADVSYDNTSSHLTADDVQGAIDELNTAIGAVAGSDKYYPMDALEHEIGDNLFVKHFSGESTTGDETLIEAFDGLLLHSYGYVGGTTYRFPLGTHVPSSNTSSDVYQTVSSGDIGFETGSDVRGHYDIWLVYQKNVESSTRKKKK